MGAVAASPSPWSSSRATKKIPVLRAYLRRWKVEIGAFLQGVGPDAPDADLARIAPGYPAFRVERRGPV